MPFDTFDDRLKAIAASALAYCKSKYGANGLAIEREIASEIHWTPSFYIKPFRFKIVAVEVADNLFPEALKGAAAEIDRYEGAPIYVFQACSLGAFQTDTNQTKVNLLRKYGFGLITVDDNGKAILQCPCVPVAQHISEEQLNSLLGGLTPQLKVHFRAAHQTYLSNEGQGLQLAGQVVEAIIKGIGDQAQKRGIISRREAKGDPADIIDALYMKPQFKDHRASLGGARGFIKGYRNTASHPARTARKAAEKIRKCKAGFLAAVGFAKELRDISRALGYRITIYVT